MTTEQTQDETRSDTEDPLEKMRREEAEMERKFPGYPPYLSEITLQKIEWTVEDDARRLRAMLAEMFGHFAVKQLPQDELEHRMRTLAQSVAHQAAGHMAVQGALQAQQASQNMMLGTLAGIALGSNTKNETHEEGTTDASTES